AADPKSDDGTLWAELLKALPNADKDRIYASDVRKLFTWYGQLLKSGDLAKKDEEKKEEKAEVKEEVKAKKAPKAKVDTAKGPKASAGGPPKAAAVRRGGQRGS
ncbi:MAG TPA: hypothetical protein PK760_06640, partial [Flavobacteriales bacterium]|nr:hypothetical protein [Flavobacteriales bacterium]